jgi:ABC-type branched-subunit amino acid transport system substrate-binding protein
MKTLAAILGALAIALSTQAIAQTQGVSKDEIVIGSLLDLSGPIVALGVPFRNGYQMRFDEANAAGGIHGRRIRFVVEDTGYDPKKAVLATQKFIERDKVFAAIGNLGSVVVNATMQSFVDAGVPHLFPGAPLVSTYEPVHKLKFAFMASYSVITPIGMKFLIKRDGYKKPGLLYQDDDTGHETMKGFDSVVKELNLQSCEKVSYKRGATDFSSQIAKLKAAGCDFVMLATIIRETIGAYTEARKIGWDVPMLVTIAGYSAQIHQLGGKDMEGLYAIMAASHPYPAGASKELAQWIDSYKKRFNIEPNVFAVNAYSNADVTVKALEKAGPNLTVDTFVMAMETIKTAPDQIGSPAYTFSAANHLGNREVRVAQIRNGRWELVSDFLR